MVKPTPTPLRDPEGYLASRKFSRKIKCRRTGLPVSYADIGEEDGVPVLWVLPSGCSRWVAAPQDPLARLYGIRLIVIDRPGCGATPPVPLADRIRLSGDMTVSVLEHLGIKLDHLIVNSAGIYYALDLLTRYPDMFTSALSPPPHIYMISPWSPLLPSDHPDYYSSYFTWIPSSVIATQHITLAKLAENSSQLWSSGTRAFWTGFSAAKALLGSAVRDLTVPSPTYHTPSTSTRPSTSQKTPSSPSPVSGLSGSAPVRSPTRRPSLRLGRFGSSPSSSATLHTREQMSDASSVTAIPPTPNLDSDDQFERGGQVSLLATDASGHVSKAAPTDAAPMTGDEKTFITGSSSLVDDTSGEGQDVGEKEFVFEGDGLWGKTPCCIGCTTTEYMQAETFSGIGQEHLICLNRGPSDTGYRHLEIAVDDFACKLRIRDSGVQGDKLDVRIWWGWQDTMVPRKGQLWFNRNMQRYPDVIQVKVRDVEDGDHTDLLSRAEGIYEVYALIRARHRGEPEPEPED